MVVCFESALKNFIANQNTTYVACSMPCDDLVPNWPFEGHLERCRGFDSLHAILALLVVVLWYINWGYICMTNQSPIDLEKGVQVKSEQLEF